MSRTLKALGLALIAAFVMSAFAAGSSQAALKITCESYPCVITGEAVKHKKNATEEISGHLFVTNTGQEVSCGFTKFDATVASAAANERVTVTPTYENCTAATGPVTVTMNGCDYEIYGGEETSEHHFVNIKADIVCPEGKKIEVHIYSNAASHTAGTAACTVTIGPQKELLHSTAQNITGKPDHVTLTTEITNIAVSGHGLLCSGAKTATYTGGTTLKAYKDLGNDPGPPVVYTEGTQIGLTVSK